MCLSTRARSVILKTQGIIEMPTMSSPCQRVSSVVCWSTFMVSTLICRHPAGGAAGFPRGSVAVSPVADSSIFAPLTVPSAPSTTRLATGAPGPRYWQNRADYDLHATLDPVTGTVTGSMTLRYTNHSPDMLPFLWFQTEQNAFRDASHHSSVQSPYGDLIDQFTEVVDGVPVAVRLEDHQTECKVTLPRPLRPGQTATLHVVWHFVVPPRETFSQPGGVGAILSMRMGREATLYQIAQWYPRVNVYDDVTGWNIEPYDGREFFLEYGNFILTVTVPADYIVAATGTLDNSAEVLTPAEIARLAQAKHSDTTIHIVTDAELHDGRAHLKHNGMVTWKFHADNVRDAVWAAAPNYLWDATNWKGISAQAYYRPSMAGIWHDAADMVRLSIQEYSERWYPYPYPQASVAEGTISGGMEYPMLAFDGSVPIGSMQDFVITHKVGHNWFPILVGSNERVHPWMDEGLNGFINAFSMARRYPADSEQGTWIQPQVLQGVGQRPIGEDPSGAAYVLQVLRQDVLGPAVFDTAFRAYIKRWAFKHPTPVDFFRTMADVAGRNLDWFWRECFMEAPRFDQAIDSVLQTVQGEETHLTVTYGNRGRAVFPLLVCFTFSDNTTQDVAYPVAVWRANAAAYTVSYTFHHKTVRRIELDPDTHLPDADRSNNAWTAHEKGS